jgi:hypothetical protein
MTLTLEDLKRLGPCKEGFVWYEKNIKTENIREILLQVNEKNSSWARWLFQQLIDKEQAVKIAIYSAELVLHIYEEKYPEDDRPRKAIEAAKEYLETRGTHAAAAADAAHAAHAAAYAAHTAAYAAHAADAAYAAAAAHAAYADAAYAAAAVGAAADAAGANRKITQEKILNYVADLLEGK